MCTYIWHIFTTYHKTVSLLESIDHYHKLVELVQAVRIHVRTYMWLPSHFRANHPRTQPDYAQVIQENCTHELFGETREKIIIEYNYY